MSEHEDVRRNQSNKLNHSTCSMRKLNWAWNRKNERFKNQVGSDSGSDSGLVRFGLFGSVITCSFTGSGSVAFAPVVVVSKPSLLELVQW